MNEGRQCAETRGPAADLIKRRVHQELLGFRPKFWKFPPVVE